MARYKVITDFMDLEDGRRIYRAGDVYPHKDAPKPTEARLESLSSDANKRNEPLIAGGLKEVEEETTEEDAENLEDMTVDELKERLDEKEIEYKSGDNKKTLIELLSE